MSRTIFILRHMLQEAAGTLETALTRRIEVRYVDLFREVPEGCRSMRRRASWCSADR